MMTQFAIELKQVERSFAGQPAVRQLDLSLPRGEICGFIGPNGSGKTTTIRMILRILRPDAGRVCVLGSEQGTCADDRLGYLPEERGLYRRMKVGQLLRYYAHLKSFRDCDEDIREWLARFDASDWINKRLDTLSKGMCQKVQFIAAVIARPQLLILDEPFSGLDPVSTEQLSDAILEMQSRGASILLSTHDMEAAERMCGRVVMIFRGRKVLDGTPHSIRAQYPAQEIRVRTAGNETIPDPIPGVSGRRREGAFEQLTLADGVAPAGVLRHIAQTAELEHFELIRPTLHRIFLRIVESRGEDRPGVPAADCKMRPLQQLPESVRVEPKGLAGRKTSSAVHPRL